MPVHLKFGGSTAARTIACPPWHLLSADVPKLVAGPAAALCTARHTVIEKCLLEVDLDPMSFANTKVDGVLLTADHIKNKIIPALFIFEDLMDSYAIAEYWPEVTTRISADIGGTADFVGLSEDGKTLVVADYKSGDGEMVFALDNAQGLFYAMILMLTPKFAAMFERVEKLVIVIVQPSDRREDPVDIWETDLARLHEFALAHEEAVRLSGSADSEPSVGKHCKYCPALATCPAKVALIPRARKIDVPTVSLDKLGEAMAIADELEGWCKEVRKRAIEELEKGSEVAGFKLVAKRASRVWNEPDVAMRKVKLMRRIKTSEAVISKLASPAQMEKLCREHGVDYKKEFSPMVSSISTGSTLATAGDKRPAVIQSDAQKLVATRFA